MAGISMTVVRGLEFVQNACRVDTMSPMCESCSIRVYCFPSEIPKEFLREFLEAKEEIEVEHIEVDLEAERVVALYLMNHYLRVSKADPNKKWWTPQHGAGSPLIDQLVREYWDQGPFA